MSEETTVTIPVRTLRRLIEKELEAFREDALKALSPSAGILSDTPRGMLRVGYKAMWDKLQACETYDDLQEFLYFADYRMSLQEWIDSL